MSYVVFDISMDENTAVVQHIRNFHASNSDMQLLSVSLTLDTGHEPKTGIIGRDRCVLGYTSLGLYDGKTGGEDKDVGRGIYW